MPSRFTTWESYFYPPPHSFTLRNLFGERDHRVLQELEQAVVSERYLEAVQGEVRFDPTFDAGHVDAIHRHLFGDVYEWAGQHRTVPLVKNPPRGFADVAQIDRYLADVHRLVVTTEWKTLDRSEFVDRAATAFAYLNQAHPFREGNGRTSKLFMTHLAGRSRFAFDFNQVTAEIWNDGGHGILPGDGQIAARWRT